MFRFGNVGFFLMEKRDYRGPALKQCGTISQNYHFNKSSQNQIVKITIT